MGRRLAALIVAVAALTACSAPQDEQPEQPQRPPSQEAGRTVAPQPKPTKPSPAAGAPSRTYPVEVRKLQLSRGKDRPLPTTVWYPETGKGPFPVIVFSHGLTAQPSDYGRFLTRWARAGFVVAAPAYPHTSTGVADFDVIDLINQPADASYVLTKILALDAKSGDALKGRLDTGHVAAAGHSGGGITTIGMLSGNRDTRLSAAVVLAGRQVLPVPFSGPATPVLFVHGKLDRTVRYSEGLAAFDAVPWPKALLTIPDGGHVTTSGKDFDLVATATTDFWRWTLYGDTTAKQRLERVKNLDDEL
ncbi:alpha/beta hydrolase family protein [Actinoplanes friuliensis]|uniref:Chlorophyllase-like protein n=1 Tax=Actinoplanes friuliensis DSM 7358 TaxID=1246995 RepID=U5WD34_9ACTN|nr:chlorophyllase-like protein [Actinoplanes friuliensis]AGZ45856.1 chlorophyllase-like protein [Actinoplanes friuliensis DSM 7358]